MDSDQPSSMGRLNVLRCYMLGIIWTCAKKQFVSYVTDGLDLELLFNHRTSILLKV